MEKEKFSKQWLKQNKKLVAVVCIVLFFYIQTIIKMINNFNNAQLDQKDMYDFTYGAKILLEGKNPYSTYDLHTRNHPPGIFFLYAFLILIFGEEYESLKIPTYLFVIFTAISIFYLTKYLLNVASSNRNIVPLKENIRSPSSRYLEKNVKVNWTNDYFSLLPWITSLLYLMDAAVQDRYAEGSYEAFTAFFFFLGFIFFFRNQHVLASFFWGISTIIQLVAFFMWPFLLLYFIKQKNWKLFAIYFGVIFSMVTISFLPFLVEDFHSTLSGFLLLASRETTNYSFFWFYPDETKNQFYRHIIPGISFWFLVQISVYSLVVLCLLLKKTTSKHNLLNSIFIIYFTLPVLTNSYGIRFLNWLAPVFYVYYVLRKKYVLVFLFYYMSTFTIRWFFSYYIDYPWLMVFGAYFFSISIMISLIFDMDSKKKFSGQLQKGGL